MEYCGVCGVALESPRQCVVCHGFFCEEHAVSVKVGKFRGRDVYAYVCVKCLREIDSLRSKPRELWTEEDRRKAGGMMANVIRALGTIGLIVIIGLFTFALWLFKTAVTALSGKGGEEGGESGEEGEGGLIDAIKQAFAGDEISFGEETLEIGEDIGPAECSYFVDTTSFADDIES